MVLLDRYVEEIGKHLPGKSRMDIQKEIRSTIEDIVEDRSNETGRPADDVLIGEVLKEYGAPAKVAASYLPTRYLIGPRLYPIFRKVLRIVFSVLFVLSLAGFAISIFRESLSGPEFLASLGKYSLDFFGGLMTAFGNIVLVFAVLERVLPSSEFEKEEEKWDPAELTAAPDPDKVGRSSLIVDVLFTVLGLALLNFYPQINGVEIIRNNTWIFFPAFSDTFIGYMPWINLLLLLRIILNFYLIRSGIWHNKTRLLNIILEVCGIALAGVMLAGPSLVTFDVERLTEVLGESSPIILELFTRLPQMVLIIVIIVQSIETVQEVWKMVRKTKF